MIFQYPFIINVLILCLILTGMHTYLGYHVIKREVIFVDLSLAQIAALGACVAGVLGYGSDNHPTANYLISLSFTLAGAAIFAFFRSKKQVVSIEVLIGICYAASSAAALIILEGSASGTEEIKNMLTGSLLTVSSKEVAFIAVLYSLTAVIHFIFRKKFLLISNSPETAGHKKLNIYLWDILFYTTFGFIVTSSVKVAGVLMVFAFLIIPAANAALFTNKTSSRIMLGWVFGLLGVIIGIEGSLRFDLQTAPLIIIVFVSILLLSWLFLKIKNTVCNR